MEDYRFDLTRVRLKSYRSIAAANVELGPLLFLVGPNGSGKSNFLDALRLVSDSLLTSLDQALRARGGVSEVRRRSTGHPTHFAIDLDFRGPYYSGKYGFTVAAVGGGGFRISREECDVWTTRTREEDPAPGRTYFKIENGKLLEHSELVMPPVSDQRLYLVSAAGIEGFRLAFDGLAGISVFNINPDAMRRPQTPDAGDFLARDGSNIASVLHRLERSDFGREVKPRIESYLQHIVPGMHSVSRENLGNWETLQFSQEVPGSKNPWHFQAQSVSDGTLRALGVLVSLFAGTGRTLSPVGIEEPETALHPAAAGILLDALRDASERRQIIVTSHSPDLLDRNDFELEELLAVRSSAGETKIGGLDKAGVLALRKQLYTPGELLRTDQLIPAPENEQVPLEFGS